jgi:MarR family transcriptional regulator, temperature-dependent positive regulator of motility
MTVKLSSNRNITRSSARLARPVLHDRATETPVDKRAAVNYGPLDRYLGFYLRRLYDNYRKHFIARAGDMDVQPREVAALVVISLNPGMTPTELSAALALDGAQITGMLNLFESRQLLERRISSSDARSRLVYLTVEGEQMVTRLYEFLSQFDQQFNSQSLNEDELRQLLGLLAKLNAATEN